MTIEEQIDAYIAAQPAAKQEDMRALHRLILRVSPRVRLWFLDGRNDEGKIVSNPNIGYGFQTIEYSGGKTRDFYQLGLSANASGISIYIIGIEDKAYLAETYGARIGKASVTGYCIKFRAMKDIDVDVLEDAIRFALRPEPGDRSSSRA